jgi:septal ring factor EnvC (AmiA/AmiB activator)
LEQHFRLVDSTDQQLSVFLQNAKVSPAVMQEFEPVFEAKRTVAAIDIKIGDKQNAISQLVDDQKRLRDNLGALRGSAEERSLAKRYTAELNAQEDRLAVLRHDLDSLQQQLKAAEA